MSGDLRRDSRNSDGRPSAGGSSSGCSVTSRSAMVKGTIALSMGPQRLLAFLAIHGPAPRSVIMGTLWPEVSEPHARGSLRTAMWRLHRGAPCLLQPAGDRLGLHPGMLVDIRTVTESAQVILQDASQASTDRAVLCARGELLPGWYDDWVIFERERLRQLRLHALDALAERFTAQGRYADALEAAMESARIEPLRESANRMIIAIHLAEANAAEALRHYRFFRDLLWTELGLEPSARLTAMLPCQGTSVLAGWRTSAALRQRPSDSSLDMLHPCGDIRHRLRSASSGWRWSRGACSLR